MIETRPVRVARQLLAGTEGSLPIDVLQIAQALDISISKQDMEDSVSGILLIEGDHAVVGVNKDHHPNRQRFTIAHELGHYLLHRTSTSVFIDGSSVFFRDGTSSEGTRLQEIEANAFAAELLMPEALLREHIGEQPLDVFDDTALWRLADLFGVSVQALSIRLSKLGLLTA